MAKARTVDPKVAPRGAARSIPVNGPQVVRIIGGVWKRSILKVVALDGLRPTPDRVRETLFNWLTHHFSGSLQGLTVFDPFAGTGALAFEAVSRGAAHALLIESQLKAVAQLQDVRERLKAESLIDVRGGDASRSIAALTRQGTQFDVIFLDPPFGEGWLARMIPLVAALLTQRGVVYVEAEEPLDPELIERSGLELAREDKAGRVFYHLLQCKKVIT